MLQGFFRFIILTLLVSSIFYSCKKLDNFTSQPVNLKFSTDTLNFDSLFGKLYNSTDSIGLFPRSITLQVRVINPTAYDVKTNISLLGNIYGFFRLNVDGRAGKQFEQIEIGANDSIYIFVQASIDTIKVFGFQEINDQLQFETNGSKQSVALVAYAQGSNFYSNKVLDCNRYDDMNWSNAKPYYLMDSVLVPKGCTLTIDAGTHIYNYNNSAILVAGTLIVNGNNSSPVIFEGSRLDDDYKELAGQWIGIRFLKGSTNNVMKSAVIKNAYIGIEIDSLSENGKPNLILEQSIIKNMSAAGIVAYSGELNASNNLIYNCGLFGILAEFGGNYELTHNTIYLGNTGTVRKDPGIVFSNSPLRNEDGSIRFSLPLSLSLKNNILYGSLDEDFFINNDAEGLPITTNIIEANLLKTKKAVYNSNGNLLNLDPLFKDVQNNDFDLKAGSPCKGAGTSTSILLDLVGRIRNSAHPSIGAYEGE
jgi:hypothetical protein